VPWYTYVIGGIVLPFVPKGTLSDDEKSRNGAPLTAVS